MQECVQTHKFPKGFPFATAGPCVCVLFYVSGPVVNKGWWWLKCGWGGGWESEECDTEGQVGCWGTLTGIHHLLNFPLRALQNQIYHKCCVHPPSHPEFFTFTVQSCHNNPLNHTWWGPVLALGPQTTRRANNLRLFSYFTSMKGQHFC